jgi:hypothetical protein
MLESNCKKLSGTFSANQKCADLTYEQCPIIQPKEGACCLTEKASDGSTVPVRCLDARTIEQCKASGGSWYEDKACADLSFEQCPPNEESGACCKTVSSGEFSYSTCDDNVPVSDCKEAGGNYFLDKACADLTEKECPVQPIGACCYIMRDGTYNCDGPMTSEDCSLLKESIFHENLTCQTLPEKSPCYAVSIVLGVCCLPKAECSLTETMSTCKIKGGIWLEEGRSCNDCSE